MHKPRLLHTEITQQYMDNEKQIKLETVSIAEPLQNRQHAQNP